MQIDQKAITVEQPIPSDEIHIPSSSAFTSSSEEPGFTHPTRDYFTTEHEARELFEDDSVPPPPYELYSSNSMPRRASGHRCIHRHSNSSETRHRGDLDGGSRETREHVHLPQEATCREQVANSKVAILLMGATGAGKSSFIASATGQSVNVGHTLDPCTVDPQGYKYTRNDGSTITLIDTPGFNDQRRPDTELLSSIINFIFAEELKIISIIYLHRITERKLTGSTMLNLRLLRSMVGEHYIPNVVLVTSMWNTVPAREIDEAIEREVQFNTSPSFWGDMIDKGAKYFRWDGSTTTPAAKSASQIIVLCHKTEIQSTSELAIMHELHKGTKLEDTETYQLLTAEIRKKLERERRAVEDEEEERRYLQEEKVALELRVRREEEGVRRELVRLEDAERGREARGSGFGPASTSTGLFESIAGLVVPVRRRFSEGVGMRIGAGLRSVVERRESVAALEAEGWRGQGGVGGTGGREWVDEDGFEGGGAKVGDARDDRHIVERASNRPHIGRRRRHASSRATYECVLVRRRR